MGDIKFRAWDKDRKCFLPCIVGNTDTNDDKWICPLTFCEVNGVKDWYNNDTCEVNQYTGLKDKNENEIYEGDILQAHGNKCDLAKVVFGKFEIIDVETLETVDKVIGWHYEVIPTDALSKCEPFNKAMPLTDFYISRCEFEVIGNIYENHELLEGGATE